MFDTRNEVPVLYQTLANWFDDKPPDFIKTKTIRALERHDKAEGTRTNKSIDWFNSLSDAHKAEVREFALVQNRYLLQAKRKELAVKFGLPEGLLAQRLEYLRPLLKAERQKELNNA